MSLICGISMGVFIFYLIYMWFCGYKKQYPELYKLAKNKSVQSKNIRRIR